MNNDLKITFPPIPEDAEGWNLFLGGGPNVIYTPRRWYHRAIYRVIMYAHDRAEELWHWLYHVSRRFEPERKIEYVEPTFYGYVARDGAWVKAEPETIAGDEKE